MYWMPLVCSLCLASFRAAALNLAELQPLKCFRASAHIAGDMRPKNYKCKTGQEIILASIELWAFLRVMVSKHAEFQPASSHSGGVRAKIPSQSKSLIFNPLTV